VQAFPQALTDVGLSSNLDDPKNTETLTAALERALPGEGLSRSLRSV
jgi:hypothetical protein